MSHEQYNADSTALDGFTERDEDGVDHQIVWQETEVSKNVEYEIWFCRTHDQPYYGSCIQDGAK